MKITFAALLLEQNSILGRVASASLKPSNNFWSERQQEGDVVVIFTVSWGILRHGAISKASKTRCLVRKLSTAVAVDWGKGG